MMDRLGVALRDWVEAVPLIDLLQIQCRAELKVIYLSYAEEMSYAYGLSIDSHCINVCMAIRDIARGNW